MPRTIETKVYAFDELTDRAKKQARQWYREVDSFDFSAEAVLDDAAEIAEMLGIEISTRAVRLMGGGVRHEPVIFYSGFCSQGDGASFSCTYRYAKGAARKVRAHAPQDAELHRIATALQVAQREYFYGLVAVVVQDGHYVHSHTMRLESAEVARPDGSVMDAPSDVAGDVLGLLRDFADWIYRRLRDEYEYQNSEEQVDEAIRANEYTFTEEGKRFG